MGANAATKLRQGARKHYPRPRYRAYSLPRRLSNSVARSKSSDEVEELFKKRTA